MAARPVRHSRRKHRIVSISLHPSEADWIDSLVQLLEDSGYPKAGRSEVVRLALLELRQSVGTRTPAEIVRYFVQRDADRLVAALVDGEVLSRVRDADKPLSDDGS